MRRLRREFKFGEGKISGVLGLFLGLLALGAVLCFRFPNLFSTAEFRGHYPIATFRVLISVFLVLAAALGLLSTILAKRVRLGLAAIAVAGLGALLGGGSVELPVELARKHSIGLDWFLLDLLLLALVFVPLERAFALHHEQRVFRAQWRTDLAYFAVNHLFLQALMAVATVPSLLLAPAASRVLPTGVIAGLPAWAQFFLLVAVVDLFQYWVHRAFHVVPALWRFHAVHHSPPTLDWLAGSRLHLVDTIVTRGILFLPLALLGFGAKPLQYYIVFAAMQTVFIHGNLRFRLDWLRYVLATPAYHHWHHASDRAAIDRNFAVHLPVWDLLFGTFYSPRGRWPRSYGVVGGRAPGNSYLRQFFYPFRRS